MPAAPSAPALDVRSTASPSPARRTASASLAAAVLGAQLGRAATLVQVSARVCGQCATLRRLLASVAADTPGVVHVEVLAEERMDLVRRLDVVRTPTLLVLDGAGRVRLRASGVPARAEIEQAVTAA